jgi:hypothetical protein
MLSIYTQPIAYFTAVRKACHVILHSSLKSISILLQKIKEMYKQR